ncbi:MAG: peptidoglycan editing factor PgeF [Leptolyngbyaceae cyanobacterium SM1_3_5]|nr:peptidoglycan editing factor PgeF [Leptolyngbyaceae cyanobacterium SM1_3_5]
MHHWHWENLEGLPYLRCSLLDAWSHGFFTRQFAPRRPESLTPILDRSASANWVRQVHGNEVLVPDEITVSPDDRSPADGVISTQANQAVWVATADCVPALIADVQTGQVAAVHAGWRGTSLRIVPRSIARLQAQGSRIENLRVALGPAIAGEVYQVSTSCAAEVAASIFPDVEDDQARLEKLAQVPESPLLSDPQIDTVPQARDRVRLDIRTINRIQLQQLGFAAEQVSIAPFCTFQDAEFFFSYRRERLKQVQWSGIVSR